MEAILFVVFLVAVAFGAGPIAAHFENTSTNHDPNTP